MDFSSSDLMSGTLKCIFSGFLELINSFSTSAMRGLFIGPWSDCRAEGSLFA